MKKLITGFLLFISFSSLAAKPKLVVGIVVDQMRYDYLYAYWNKYSENGFKKLIKYGYNCKNTNYNYVPTYTAPGHASIYTGTTPSVHGIIGNDWYDRKQNAKIYCTEDNNVAGVGTLKENGKMSPRNMLSTTIGDEIKLASQLRSKVIGVALKDRSAILPAGHSANGAFWFDELSGDFITSTFYMKELPKWLIDFNAKKLAAYYVSQKWELFLPADKYTEAIADDNNYEYIFPGEKRPVFPHDLAAISKANEGSLGIIKATPFGNTLTTDLALAAIQGEELGKDEYTDMLAVSYSSPDYVGHYYGPKSVEMEDCYIRLDLEIAKLITYLEKNIGKENFILFLTADHAAVDNPAYLRDLKIPSGYLFPDKYADSLNNFLLQHFPLNDPSYRFINYIINNQVYLNYELLSKLKIDHRLIEEKGAEYFATVNGISNIMTKYYLIRNEYSTGIKNLIQNGFNENRSGDIVINFAPGWLEYGEKGTSHGAPYSYDTHVPLLFYGSGISKGFTAEYINITDIAPTVCLLLNIPFTNGNTGNVITPLIKN